MQICQLIFPPSNLSLQIPLYLILLSWDSVVFDWQPWLTQPLLRCPQYDEIPNICGNHVCLHCAHGLTTTGMDVCIWAIIHACTERLCQGQIFRVPSYVRQLVHPHDIHTDKYLACHLGDHINTTNPSWGGPKTEAIKHICTDNQERPLQATHGFEAGTRVPRLFASPCVLYRMLRYNIFSSYYLSETELRDLHATTNHRRSVSTPLHFAYREADTQWV